MSTETLTFACPVCNSRLTVPVALAGVIGPCPKCQTRIQAPSLPAVPQRPTVAAAPPSAAPVQTYIPQPPPQPIPAPQPAAASAPAPVLEIPVVQPAEKPAYKPEPRALPNRREGMEPIGKRMSDSMKTPQDHSERRTGSGALRVLVPVVFLGLAAGMVFAILTFLKQQEQPPVQFKSLIPPVANSSTSATDKTPVGTLPPAPVEPDESAPVAPPVPEVLVPPDPSSSPVTKPVSSTSAFQILDKFLSLNTLEERIPLMETSTSPADLAASCLASSLPPRVSVTPSIQTDNPVENSTDHFFQVIFTRSIGGTETYNMLVRRRGDQEPKVIIDPFLDVYGENSRLRRYTTAAVEKPAVFRVYVETVAICNNTKIPNNDKKFTLKLRGDDATDNKLPAIAIAYSGKASAIGEMLQNADSGLRWGSPKACTIVLNWNTKDDPAHPYLEANSIKSLSWNP
ncbi:hypothetical protein KBB96_07895 [Luteolibacter ambystomatis]|uniref:Uncharacterized protein n=1 Tax=Luteolibacter ambystomatis TaxID=2824561 RepID=A0A975J2I9_9BACT|nr:hypothetical protein [Luteolibacter ambystomatis]QUE52804.1 hypothetical protein KBB96_07895 [Luteolibacter ambystomatis]